MDLTSVASRAPSINGPKRAVAMKAAVLPLADKEKHQPFERGRFPDPEII
jgi:hypothetical protein